MSHRRAGKVVMVGTSLNAPGGMTSVVRTYRDFGFFDDWNVCYLSSYEKPGLATQLSVVFRALFAFVVLLLARKVALLHVHSASRGSFWRKSVFCALARLFGVPYVFHIHSGEFPVFVRQECAPWARRWVVHTLRKAQCVIALTATWCSEIESLAPGARVTVLGNPVVSPEAIPARQLPALQVLFLGRLREKKGVFDLLDAIPQVLESVPGARFVLAGDGDLEGVAARAEKLGVSHTVSLPGWVDGSAKDRLLAEAGTLVLPSYFEGLPVCILEAMALGVPVVASSVGGIPDVLEDGACGWLIEAGDTDGLSVALVSALRDEAAAESLRVRAYQRARDFYSVPAIFNALAAIYGFQNQKNEGA